MYGKKERSLNKKKKMIQIYVLSTLLETLHTLSLTFQTIFWVNRGVKVKQLAQGHTAGSGRDKFELTLI